MAIFSIGCVKHASSTAYSSVKPLTVNGEKDAWCGTEAPAVLLELFHLTLGSKSLQINISPQRTGSSHHYGHHRDPSAGAGATHAFHSAVRCCHFPSSEPAMPRSWCAPLSSGSRSPAEPSWQQQPLLWPGLVSAQPRDTCANEGQNRMWHLPETGDSAGVPDCLQRHGPNQQVQLCKLDLYISVIKSVSSNKDRTCSLYGNWMCQV